MMHPVEEAGSKSSSRKKTIEYSNDTRHICQFSRCNAQLQMMAPTHEKAISSYTALHIVRIRIPTLLWLHGVHCTTAGMAWPGGRVQTSQRPLATKILLLENCEPLTDSFDSWLPKKDGFDCMLEICSDKIRLAAFLSPISRQEHTTMSLPATRFFASFDTWK